MEKEFGEKGLGPKLIDVKTESCSVTCFQSCPLIFSASEVGCSPMVTLYRAMLRKEQGRYKVTVARLSGNKPG